jgi:hypothetical protein
MGDEQRWDQVIVLQVTSIKIKVYLSRALNTTVVDLTVKCLLTGFNQYCKKKVLGEQ